MPPTAATTRQIAAAGVQNVPYTLGEKTTGNRNATAAAKSASGVCGVRPSVAGVEAVASVMQVN
jgi:hypothetical protein